MTIARTGRFLIALLVLLLGAAAANAQQSAQPPAFTQQELDQILAPIALYPDSLLSQIMEPTDINPATRIAFIDAPDGVSIELLSRKAAP